VGIASQYENYQQSGLIYQQMVLSKEELLHQIEMNKQ